MGADDSLEQQINNVHGRGGRGWWLVEVNGVGGAK